MNFNGGCNCGCNGFGKSDVLCTLQQGDTFTAHLVYKNDDEKVFLSKSEELLIAFWDYKRELIHQGNVWETDENSYIYNIDHETSMKMVGVVEIELTLVDYKYTKGKESKAVYHGDKVVKINFEPRNNNTIIH